ncbi:MAG TPA: SusC/RagA family TonB-linked outer membrane protein [Longimicrobium sp.]|jgi:TonB-linked SusC/RagA family outer membrane protein
MTHRTWLLVLGCALAARGAPAAAQQREVSGTVVSAQNATPLPGARVAIAGTSQGVNAGPGGAFRLSVPAGAVTLRATMLGYQSRDVVVPAGESTVTIRLETGAVQLEDLVVTGQATSVARRNLANAVATVSGEDVERAPAQTVDKALQGKVAGAIISTNSGAPGGGVQVDLRGVSSINASADPLWIIDGVVMSNVSIPSGQNAVTQAIAADSASNQDAPTNRISDLNPDDIESIEILKGASAAAIYGSKASNGVIIITTRRGREGRPRISFSQRFGYYELANTLGSRSFDRTSAVAAFGAGAGAFFNADGTPIAQFDQEELLAGRRDLATGTSLSVSGGSGGTRYFVSGLLENDPGIIANTGFQKQSLRLNLDQRLGERVEVSLNTNVLHTLAARGLSNNDNASVSFYMVLSGTPSFVDLRGSSGVFPFNPFGPSNPLQTAALMSNDENVWRVISSGTVKADLVRGERHSLRLLLTGGADFFNQENGLLFPPELQFEAQGTQPGTVISANADNLNLNGNVNLVHTFTPEGAAWTATTSAGVQYEDRDLTIDRIVTRDLVAGQGSVDAGPSNAVFDSRQRVQDLGVYVQEEFLGLDSRLLLTASLRADRSSNNGDPGKYFFYPKAAASYRFPDLAGWLDDLKLRVAYGETGNQPLYGQKFTTFNGTNSIGGVGGLVIGGTAGDPDIRPEREREIEGGFDLTLFDGRAAFEATAYLQRITDLLLQRTLASSTGFTTQVFNGGELHTRGLELALSATPIDRGDLSWTSRTTFYTTKSTIENLPVPTFRTGAFGSTALGVFQIEEGESATQIVGRNGLRTDGSIIEEQLGDATPQWKMGFSNELRWRTLGLYSLFDWQHGGDVINLTRLLYDFGSNSPDFALPAGVSTPRAVPDCIPNCSGLERVSGFGVYTGQYVEDASFVKLREVSLTWYVPERVRRALPWRVDDARISLSGRNLVTWTDYTGLDPEVSNFGNQQIARSVDVAPFPPSRSFWLTFNLGL